MDPLLLTREDYARVSRWYFGPRSTVDVASDGLGHVTITVGRLGGSFAKLSNHALRRLAELFADEVRLRKAAGVCVTIHVNDAKFTVAT
jgi:hypothetical protein